MKKTLFTGWILLSLLLVIFLPGFVPVSYSDDFDTYIQWLSSPDRYHREYAAFKLGQIKDPRAVGPVIAALKDEDRNVREDAAIALGKIGDPSAVQPLIGVLNDFSVMVKIAAVNALGNLKDQSAVGPVSGLLQDRDPRVRVYSALNLGELKDPKSLDALNTALNDLNEDVRLVAAGAMCFMEDSRGIEPLLAALKKADTDEEVKIWNWVIISLLKVESQAIEPLKKAMKDQDSDVRSVILDILAVMKDPRTIDILIESTKDPDEDVRLRAVEILEKKNDPRTIEPLIRLLKDTDEDVRVATARFLGKSGNPIVIDPLTAALGDLEWKVQEAAAAALIPFKDQRATRPLIVAMKDDDVMIPAHKALAEIGTSTVELLLPALKSVHEYIRIGAANALGLIKDERAVQPLIAAVGDPKGDVREAAVAALSKFGAISVEPLIEALKNSNEDFRSGAADALGIIKDNRAVDPLIASLKDEESDVRESATRALGNIADPKTVEALIEALKDRDSDVRALAATALGNIKDPRAVQPLLAAGWDRDTDVQIASGRALSVFKESKAIRPLLKLVGGSIFSSAPGEARKVIIKFGVTAAEPLISALKDADDGIVSDAASILGDLNDPRAIEPLSVLLVKRESSEAFQALRKMTIGQDTAVSLLNQYMDGGKPIYPAKLFKALGSALENGGANVNDVLMKAIIHDDPVVRVEAALLISKSGDKQMLEKLTNLLQDVDYEVRIYTAYGLLKNGDTRGLEVFSKMLQKLDTNVLVDLDREQISERYLASEVLSAIDDLRTADLLLNLLSMRDIAGIAGAYRFYLKYQIDGAESLLVVTLEDFGTLQMVEAYLNYGSILLTKECEKWARMNGYYIVKKKLAKIESTP
jgi:HEAT repeat protein